MATYLSQNYPVPRWRGREIRVLATLAKDMKVVEFADETKGRTLFAEAKYIVETEPEPEVPAQSPRMFILEELQKFESVLFDAWEGDAETVAVTAAFERMIDLYLKKQ